MRTLALGFVPAAITVSPGWVDFEQDKRDCSYADPVGATRTFVCGDVMPTKEQIDLHQEAYAGIPGIEGIRQENQIFITEGEPAVLSTLAFDERLMENVHPSDKKTGRRKAYLESPSAR